MDANRTLYRYALAWLHAYDLTPDYWPTAGYTQWARVQKFTAAGWLVSCPGHALLATEGTVGVGTQPRNLLTWLDHVDFAQVDVPPGGKAHNVWWQRAQGYASEVASACTAQGVTTLDLCGHSYGGALSMLLPWHLEQAGLTVGRIVTAGCPRVGNAAYGATLPETWRVERGNDIVPWVPVSTTVWLLALPWTAIIGGALGFVVPHGPLSASYTPAGELVWCADQTVPPRRVTNPLDLAGVELRRRSELLSCLLRPETALRLATDHSVQAYLSHVSIPVP